MAHAIAAAGGLAGLIGSLRHKCSVTIDDRGGLEVQTPRRHLIVPAGSIAKWRLFAAPVEEPGRRGQLSYHALLAALTHDGQFVPVRLFDRDSVSQATVERVAQELAKLTGSAFEPALNIPLAPPDEAGRKYFDLGDAQKLHSRVSSA